MNTKTDVTSTTSFYFEFVDVKSINILHMTCLKVHAYPQSVQSGREFRMDVHEQLSWYACSFDAVFGAGQ